jgi:hypothetical protein
MKCALISLFIQWQLITERFADLKPLSLGSSDTHFEYSALCVNFLSSSSTINRKLCHVCVHIMNLLHYKIYFYKTVLKISCPQHVLPHLVIKHLSHPCISFWCICPSNWASVSYKHKIKIRKLWLPESVKVKVKVTLVQALRLCTGRTPHSVTRGIALLFHDQRH